MKRRINRRTFVRSGAAAGVALWAGAPVVLAGPRTEKLNLALIGVGGRGAGNLRDVGHENIVALCDVDEANAAKARQAHPGAVFYTDYRELLADLAGKLDAVVVSTPDHMHAPVALSAMNRGLHAYCEKPLTWSIEEARAMANLAREKGLATQMGNQGTASDGFRKGVDSLRAGILGPVHEVHIWTNRPVWPQAIERPTDTQPVPAGLHWDLWLGCAPERPFHAGYHPFSWRGWYDFGTGALGDMACHTVNLAYMGLDLGAPERIEAQSTPLFAETYPAGARITYSFPARGEQPAVKLTWYDGQHRPDAGLLGGRELPGSGALIVGERGTMFSPDDYGARQEVRSTKGEALVIEAQAGKALPKSPGHHREWLAACRGEGRGLSHFGHAGPFTECMLLGNLAVRLGKPIEWDSAAMRVKDNPQAEALIRRDYREGFAPA
jgi:predicted dehydrogenase